MNLPLLIEPGGMTTSNFLFGRVGHSQPLGGSVRPPLRAPDLVVRILRLVVEGAGVCVDDVVCDVRQLVGLT